MKLWKSAITVGALLVSAAASFATVVKEGTDVALIFKQALRSQDAKPGDRVRMEVERDVKVNGRVVLTAGTPVWGTIERVNKRGVFGKNGSIRLSLTPVGGIPLQPRTKGNEYKGSRTDHAALIAGGGALILGPIGLVGGLFVKGKNVTIKPGDHLATVVSRTVDIR